MEFLGAILIIIVFHLVIRAILAGGRVAAAGAKSALTGQEFDANKALGRIPPFSARLVRKNTEPDGGGLKYFSVEVRGLFPINFPRDLTITTSVFDISEGKEKPKVVLGSIDPVREAHTPAYFQRADIGVVHPNQGFTKWVEVGRVFELFTQTPHSGRRKIEVLVRVLPISSVENITLGFDASKPPQALWSLQLEEYIQKIGKGYEEAIEQRKEAMKLGIKLAMSVALSDGNLADEEGEELKSWMSMKVLTFAERDREQTKAAFNESMRDAYSEIVNDNLSISLIVERINQIAEEADKYEIMELCYDIMAADGVADQDEVKMLHRLGDALKLDSTELEKIRDNKMISLSSSLQEDSEAHTLLGMDDDWSREQKKAHLRAEFRKWNARSNSAQAQADRLHAQRMLDLIGEERKKYD